MSDECKNMRANSILQIITEIENILEDFDGNMIKHAENINFILHDEIDKHDPKSNNEETLKGNSPAAQKLIHILNRIDNLKARLNHLDNNIDLN